MTELKLATPPFDIPIRVDNITDENAQELATQIVMQAIEDHTHAVVKGAQLECAIEVLKEKDLAQALRLGIGSKFYEAVLEDMRVAVGKQEAIARECERFFMGQEFEMYSTMDGKELVEALKKHEATLAQEIIDGTRKRVKLKNIV